MESFELLAKLRKDNPLIHNMTNQVVANYVANGLLAIGAAPIMAYAEEEVEEIVAKVDCLVLNIGTLTGPVLEGMIVASKKANQEGIPVVLDPVGVGASTFRQKAVKRLLEESNITLIRGNAGEIAQLGGIEWRARGVDSGSGDYALEEMALEVARFYQCVVAISGETDWISDGKKLASVKNGHELMTKITGMGCLLSAVCGSFIGSHHQVFESTVAAHIVYGIAGEEAAKASVLPGSFKQHFLDQLSLLSEEKQNQINYQKKGGS